MRQRNCWYICDVCEEVESPPEINFTEATRSARKEGWLVSTSAREGYHICPDCRGGR